MFIVPVACDLPTADAAQAALVTAQSADAAQAQPARDGADPDDVTIEPRATLDLAIVYQGRRLAEVPATISASRLYAIDAAALAAVLGELVDDTTIAALAALGAGQVPVDDIAASGISARLDPADLSIAIELAGAGLRTREFAASQGPQFEGYERVMPQDVAIGLTGALTIGGRIDGGFDPDWRGEFRGFANVGGLDGVNVDYGATVDMRGDTDELEFRRDRIVAFKDWPDRAQSLAIGDLLPDQARLAGSFDIAGISFSKNYERLQPLRNVRPTASRSLVLERPSMVEVYVNDILIERFAAQPGPIDISQIPLVGFGNNVSVVVEDSFGRREIESFSFGSDIDQLARGIEQFDFSVGLLRDPHALGLSYSDDPVASAFYELGLTDRFTIAGSAVVSEALQSVGAAGSYSLGSGVMVADLSASNAQGIGAGFAGSVSFRGAPFLGIDANEFATVTFEYRTQDFRSLDQFLSIPDIKFDLRADYQANIAPRLAAFVNGSFVDRYGGEQDKFVSAGLRFSIGRGQLTLAGRYSDRSGGGSEVGLFAAISLSLGPRSSIFANYDTISGRGRAEYRKLRGLELPELEYRLGYSRTPDDNTVFGGVGFGTSRFDSSLDLSQAVTGTGGANPTFGRLRFQTGLAFADGKLAIGRDPGRGFAIVARHPSLDGAEFAASRSTIGRELAFANGFGPAVVPLDTPYRAQPLVLEARNLPIGYDLGAGRYLLETGARSGFMVELGSDDFRSAVAVLEDRGEPVGLTYGSYFRIDRPDAPKATFFTNREGRAVFAELAPGRYAIEIPQRNLTGQFVIAENGDTIIDLGRIPMEMK